MNERHCALSSCGKALNQKLLESNYVFNHRRYCDKDCANEALIKILPIRFCKVCSRQLIKGRTENKSHFLRRKTCTSVKCVREARINCKQCRIGRSVAKVGRVAWTPENEARLSVLYDLFKTALEAGSKEEGLAGIVLDVVRDEPDRVLLGGVRRAA
jgi:hypothetical protein